MIKKILCCFFILVLSVAIIMYYHIYHIYTPLKSSKRIIIVEIYRGMGVKKIASVLKIEGIIRDEFAFKLLVKIKKAEDKIKAGEYKLSSSMNMIEILSILVAGSYQKLTIPEGYNMFQIADLLSQKGLVDKDRFLYYLQNKNFIAKLNICALTLEGYLFPATYYIVKGDSEEKIIRMLVAKSRTIFTSQHKKRVKELQFSIHQVLTLASIIEKEVGVPEERALVSAVFHNRLKQGMQFESCSTVIYALLPDFDGNLTKEDLKTPSLYNTYLHHGFPPGPIANPGMAAIKAVLYPAKVNYLYFVSTNDGRHKFSSTLEEHNKAVLQYQPPHYEIGTSTNHLPPVIKPNKGFKKKKGELVMECIVHDEACIDTVNALQIQLPTKRRI